MSIYIEKKIVSTLSDYVLQTELPMGWKFVVDTNESIVKHVAQYQIEAEDITNNENLKMKFLPNAFTKNDFTWLTNLPPHSICSWNQLKRVFHE